jgi:NADH-quinone oxidoreductase subunit J
MVLAHRERHEAPQTQRDRSLARFRPGAYGAPLPGPGVYARHNAVDTPALLPDGSPAQISLSPVLIARGDVRGVPGSGHDVAVRDEEATTS